MIMSFFRRATHLAAGFGIAVVLAGAPAGAIAQATSSIDRSEAADTFSSQEMIKAGHHFFGVTTRGVAEAIESVFDSQGKPSAYIVGEEARARSSPACAMAKGRSITRTARSAISTGRVPRSASTSAARVPGP